MLVGSKIMLGKKFGNRSSDYKDFLKPYAPQQTMLPLKSVRYSNSTIEIRVPMILFWLPETYKEDRAVDDAEL